MNQVYIFRGSPASGKGTITKEFVKCLPGQVAFFTLDTFRWGFHLVNREVADVSEEEHAIAYKNFLSVLENYLAYGKYTILIEGLFSWNTESSHGNMKDIFSLCEKYNQSTQPVLLKAEYEVLWKRNLERSYSVPEWEFRELYQHVMHEVSDLELQIDVGKNSVEDTLAILKNLL